MLAHWWVNPPTSLPDTCFKRRLVHISAVWGSLYRIILLLFQFVGRYQFYKSYQLKDLRQARPELINFEPGNKYLMFVKSDHKDFVHQCYEFLLIKN